MRPHVVPNYHTFYPIFLPQSPSLHGWANGKSAVELSSILGELKVSKLSNLGVLKVSKLSNLGALKVLETLFFCDGSINKAHYQTKEGFGLWMHMEERFFSLLFFLFIYYNHPRTTIQSASTNKAINPLVNKGKKSVLNILKCIPLATLFTCPVFE
jgi:hypothetical protein